MDLALTCGRARRPGAGFSLVEAILASLILLVVALGVLPLFTRAMASNFAGAEATSLSNMTSGRAEELYQLPFDHPELTVPVGSTERLVDECWTAEDGHWVAGTAAEVEADSKQVLWTRQTRIRQFNINDLLTNAPTPLDGGIPPGSVHVKEIDVEVASARTDGIALGPNRALRVRLFKAQ